MTGGRVGARRPRSGAGRIPPTCRMAREPGRESSRTSAARVAARVRRGIRHRRRFRKHEGPLAYSTAMTGTALSTDPRMYRKRLADVPDAQIDDWASELMRDVVIRRGIVKVVADFRAAAKLTEGEFERVFAFGGGAPRTLGRDAGGHLVVPTVSLWALVPGLRGLVSDSRARLIDYLVANFHELVYV